LMSLLQRFGVVVPMDETGQQSLVPAMIIDSRGAPFPTPSNASIRRRYQFTFMPKDLFPRLIVLLLHFFESSECEWQWNNFRWRRDRSEAVLSINEARADLSVTGPDARERFCVIHSQILNTAQFWQDLMCVQFVVQGTSTIPIEYISGNELPEFGALLPRDSISDLVEIGKGSFGRVWRAQISDAVFAVKEFESGEGINELTREANIMRQLDHPNLIKLHGVIELNGHPAIVLEYAPYGSLADVLHNRDIRLPLELRLRIALDIASGMDYLHSRRPRVLHRDLKSPNVLMMSVDPEIVFNQVPMAKVPTIHPILSDQFQLGDFGLSVHSASSIEGDAAVQNPRWLAPEVLLGEAYNHFSDVYSFAVLLWELASRKAPFSSHQAQWRFDYLVEEAVLKGERPPLAEIEEDMQCFARICGTCWYAKAEKRARFSSLVKEFQRKLDELQLDATY
jgi:serine/threonine protein kinase